MLNNWKIYEELRNDVCVCPFYSAEHEKIDKAVTRALLKYKNKRIEFMLKGSAATGWIDMGSGETVQVGIGGKFREQK